MTLCELNGNVTTAIANTKVQVTNEWTYIYWIIVSHLGVNLERACGSPESGKDSFRRMPEIAFSFYRVLWSYDVTSTRLIRRRSSFRSRIVRSSTENY